MAYLNRCQNNAAGCSVMMEVVRMFKSLNVQPKRTIRIALWSGEEQGLLGSHGYVKKHFADINSMQQLEEYNKFPLILILITEPEVSWTLPGRK